METLLHSKDPVIITSNPAYDPTRWVLLHPFYRLKDWGAKGLSSLPEIIELESKDLNPCLSNIKQLGISTDIGFQDWIFQVSYKANTTTNKKSILICLKENIIILNN